MAALHAAGIDALVIEAGPDLDDRDAAVPEHYAGGVGGAGLFSDGKFSFHPSATAMWECEPGSVLRHAYDRIVDLLAGHGMTAPSFPTSGAGLPAGDGDHFQAKRYPSAYLSLEARYRLNRDLAAATQGRRVRGSVTKVSYDGSGLPEIVVLAGDIRTTVRARCVIYAGGRFGTLSAEFSVTGLRTRFRRVEIGVRIEQPSADFFLRSDGYLDSKYILPQASSGVEWRTFCCCREGMVVRSVFGEWQTLSGRADCPPTGLSNVGFNARITDPVLGARIWDEVTARLRGTGRELTIPLAGLSAATMTSALANVYGDYAAEALAFGFARLSRDFDIGTGSSGSIHGPCVEGVGTYLLLTRDLRATGGAPIWFAGDSTGIFRGLTAALVSGYFVALRTLSYLRSDVSEDA
ncbi:MAG TPA: hypothetical protein VN408_27315 [Actinoplanes sp.]|nr:hypothetical protein [Actinoplanes sp.]